MAHTQSIDLQMRIQSLSDMASPGDVENSQLSPESRERLSELKRQYLAVREVLLSIVLVHAPAVVETANSENLHELLFRTSLALQAGVDLMTNFYAVSGLLQNNEKFRDVWNESDSEHGVPADSWERSIQAGRNEHYRDLLEHAIKRIKRYETYIENHRSAGETDFLAILPDGTAAALRQAEQKAALLLANYAAEDLTEDERTVRHLVERSKELRKNWATSSQALNDTIVRERGLIRGNIHLRIQVAKQDYMSVREELYRIAFKHLAKLTRNDIPYQPEFRMHAIAISVLAAVTLYENARQIQSILLRVPALRELLNEGDQALGIPPRFWDNMEREFMQAEYRNLLEAGIRATERERGRSSASSSPADSFLVYVGNEIAVNAVVANIRGEAFPSKTTRVLSFYLRRIGTFAETAPKQGKTQVSKGFGNVMGVFEFRKGKLFNQPDWIEFVRQRLRPGDILLEKTPFRLTDKFIPGHLGHVAIYVGTENQLRDLGLHTHPLVIQYASQVGEGRTIVEALRDGTQINSIPHFLNIDDLAILRPKPRAIRSEDVIQAIVLAFSHVGKKYDFGFDTKTWDTIVCSELAFQSYVNVRWTFAKVLASYTISPDDVAIFAGSDESRPFELITFIHDGQIVHDQPTGINNEAIYVSLLGKHYADAAR